jgi:F-type H+-transporting ATPase subunit epsilon
VPVRVVSVEKSLFEGEADFILARGADGELGILPGHSPLITTLRPGELLIRHDSESESLFVGGGFLEVLPDRVTVVAQVAERAEALDVARAEEGMRRAEETLGSSTPIEVDFERARLALLRTLQQLQSETRRP